MAYDQAYDVRACIVLDDGNQACDALVCIALDDDTPVCNVPGDDIQVFYLVRNVAWRAYDHHGIRAVYAIHSDALVAYNIRAVYVVHNDEVVVYVRHDNVRRRIDIRPESVLPPLLSAMLKGWPV